MIRYVPHSGRLSLDLGGFAVGTATYLGYVTPILGGLASTIAIVWYAIQIYYFFKDRKRS